MKIHPDQIDSVRQEQQKQVNKAKQPTQAFGDLLNREVEGGAKADKTARPASVPPLPGLQGIDPMLQIEAASGVEKPGAADTQAAERMESLLDQWDAYAASLESSPNLRESHSTLEKIAGGIAQLKEEMPADPTLRSMVDDLEAMAYTERFKFNRGDYV